MRKHLSGAILGALMLMFVRLFTACGEPEMAELKSRTGALDHTAHEIGANLHEVRQLAELFAGFATETFTNADRLEAGYTHSEYAMQENIFLYKPKDDGGSAVFVSGFVPITSGLRKRVRVSEYLDLFMIPVVKGHPEIGQAYFNDRDSHSRVYPFFDVLTQVEPRLDVRTFNFYYLADEEHNPAKRGVWVDEPYVDPAGRGWMISAIAPVYVGGSLLGVCGLDITIQTIVDRYLGGRQGIYVIIDKHGMVVATEAEGARLLRLPPLVDHKYLETVTSNRFRSEQFNLLKSTNKEIRSTAEQIVGSKQTQNVIETSGRKYTILSTPIDELKWTLLQIVPQ